MDELNKIRTEIDRIDKEIIVLIRKRAEKAKKIGETKRKLKLKIENKEREEEIQNKLKTEYEKNIFKKIIEESRKIQEDPLT